MAFGNNIRDLKHFLTALCALFVLMASSCGLNDDPPADSGVYDIGNLQGGCELNTENLEKILEQNITADINCLETTLDQFVQFVRRDDPRFIARNDLSQFVDKFFPEERVLIKNILKLVYNLNTLLNRDPQDKINVANLGKIFNIARVVNIHGAPLYSQLEGLTKENYWLRRKEIFNYVELAARDIINTIYVKDPKSEAHLSITDFLEDIIEILELEDDVIDVERIKSFLFIKRLILGGENDILTTEQLIDLLNRGSDLVVLGMDAIFFEGQEFASSTDEYYFYFDVVKELKGQIKTFNDTDLILTKHDILAIIDEFFGDDVDVNNLDKGLRNFKEKFFGGAADQYLYRDINTLLTWAVELSGMLYFNEITYSYFEPQMNSPKAISNLSQPKLENYHLFPKHELKKHWDNFNYITSRYRYFQDDDGKSHYFNYYKRFRSGFQLSSMLRYAITKVVKVYGHYPQGSVHKEADKEDFKTLLNDYKDILVEFDFWPEDLDDFVTDAIVSSDLFMFHSDGNDSGGSEEFTEFAVNALHAYKVSDTVYDELKNHCPLIGEDAASFEISCFREYFLHVFFNKLEYQNYYDKLFEYLKTSGVETVRRYIINVELYSRLEEDPTSPLTKSQLSRFIIILSNLESAYIKFDKDKNGILNRKELDEAYKVFRGLVMSVADLGEGKEKLYKSIFLYLVKHMEIPSPLKLSWFHLFGNKKDITSTRFNISAILSSFSL
jgi:hypothetical protein